MLKRLFGAVFALDYSVIQLIFERSAECLKVALPALGTLVSFLGGELTLFCQRGQFVYSLQVLLIHDL